MASSDGNRQQRQLERLERQTVTGWLDASEKLDQEVDHDREIGDTRHELTDLQHEVETLKGLNHALDRMLHDAGPHIGSSGDDAEAIEWIRDNVDEIQIRIGALAEEIERNATITEDTRTELLTQYEQLRIELDEMDEDPERANGALDMLRGFVRAVAHYMERVVHDVVHDWLPIARVLLPLLGPGAPHGGTPHDPTA